MFRILQARPVTALPDPEAAVPETWPLPYRHGLYFRASIVEQLPDPLTPLFADLIDPSVTASLSALMSKAFGRNVMREGDVGLPTVNGYAYYYYRNSGFMRVLALSPIAVARLGRARAGMGLDGWKNESHPAYRAAIEAWAQRDWKSLPGDELLAAAVELLDAGTRYYTAVQSVVPMAATSEIAFRAFYDKLVKAPGDPAADTFLLGFDSEPIRAEYSLYDLAAWARERPGLADRLLATDSAALAAEVLDPGAHGDGRRRTCARCRPHRVPGAIPDPPATVRACGLQPGLRHPGAGRRPRAVAGHPEIQPARRGRRPARTPTQFGATPRGKHRTDHGAPRRGARPGPSGACWPGRKRRRRCARTRSPTSGWPGRCCGPCCWSWGSG